MKISTHTPVLVLTLLSVFGARLHEQHPEAACSNQSPVAAMAKLRLDGKIAARNIGGRVPISAVTSIVGTAIASAVAATRTPELSVELKCCQLGTVALIVLVASSRL